MGSLLFLACIVLLKKGILYAERVIDDINNRTNYFKVERYIDFLESEVGGRVLRNFEGV